MLFLLEKMRGAAFLLFCCLPLAAQQASVEGVASDALTHAPLAGVHIRLSIFRSGGPSIAYGAMSDAAGHFSIAAIRPGTYDLKAEHRGYLYLGAQATAVKAGPNDLKLEMTPPAVVSGRVLDENGDPMPGLTVRMVSVTNKITIPVPTLPTDEQGGFRIRTAPGKYYVEVFTPPSGLNDIADTGSRDPIYVTTWFPDSPKKAQARAIEAVAGSETGGIDIRLRRQIPLRLSGVVKGLPDGAPGVMVFAIASNVSVSTPVEKDGKFAFVGAPPGTYRLAVLGAGALAGRWVTVTLDNEDVTDVVLTLQPGEELSGTLEMPGDRTKATVLLTPRSAFETRRGAVDKNGAFTVRDVPPGSYSVDVDPLPGNSYVKEIRLDGAVVNGDLDLSNGVKGSKLKIVVSPDGGEISGAVLSADGGRSIDSRAQVCVFARGETKATHCQAVADDGTYTLHALRPGKYGIVAISLARILGADDLKPFAAAAAEIEIKAGDKLTRDLKPMDADGK